MSTVGLLVVQLAAQLAAGAVGQTLGAAISRLFLGGKKKRKKRTVETNEEDKGRTKKKDVVRESRPCTARSCKRKVLYASVRLYVAELCF